MTTENKKKLIFHNSDTTLNKSTFLLPEWPTVSEASWNERGCWLKGVETAVLHCMWFQAGGDCTESVPRLLQLEGKSPADGCAGPSLQGAHLSRCPQQVHWTAASHEITSLQRDHHLNTHINEWCFCCDRCQTGETRRRHHLYWSRSNHPGLCGFSGEKGVWHNAAR